jgi:serine/threonine-protein kinase
MGGIWRGRHIELKSPVAIKFLDLAVTRETEMHGRFLQEARSTAAVRCAHVVQVFDYGKDENTPPFIVMELLEGETLERRLARGVLTALELDKIFREVACGISRAHAMGVVHRDLKPSNIFIAREGLQEVTKLIDFGIAKVDEQRLGFTPRAPTRAGTVIGTPEYMSPEQLRAGAEVDCSVDLWALAVVAFECLTGKLPFSGKSLTDLAVQICTEKPLTPSALACVPAGFDRWFAKATHRDSASRFASAEDMAAALSAVLQSAKAASPQQPGGAAAALRHAALWLSPRRAVVLGLALASAASIFVFRPAPPPHLPAASLAPQPGAAQQQPAPAETAREPAATSADEPCSDARQRPSAARRSTGPIGAAERSGVVCSGVVCSFVWLLRRRLLFRWLLRQAAAAGAADGTGARERQRRRAREAGVQNRSCRSGLRPAQAHRAPRPGQSRGQPRAAEQRRRVAVRRAAVTSRSSSSRPGCARRGGQRRSLGVVSRAASEQAERELPLPGQGREARPEDLLVAQ